jgi:hypothetical protein
MRGVGPERYCPRSDAQSPLQAPPPRAVVYTAEGRKRKTIYGKTRQEVAAKLSKVFADREGGLIFDAGIVTVGEYLDKWLSDSVRGTVRVSTLRASRGDYPYPSRTGSGEYQAEELYPGPRAGANQGEARRRTHPGHCT